MTVGVLEFGRVPHALPPLETRAKQDSFYSFEAKRDPDLTKYVCPADLSDDILVALAEHATVAHEAVGCFGYSRSDFVIVADGQVRWLELNTLPGLSREGNLARIAAAAGVHYDLLIAHLYRSALADRTYG